MTAKRPIQPAGSDGGRLSPTAPESKSASANVWEMLESSPTFTQRLERGRAQLATGRKVRFEDDR